MQLAYFHLRPWSKNGREMHCSLKIVWSCFPGRKKNAFYVWTTLGPCSHPESPLPHSSEEETSYTHPKKRGTERFKLEGFSSLPPLSTYRFSPLYTARIHLTEPAAIKLWAKWKWLYVPLLIRREGCVGSQPARHMEVCNGMLPRFRQLNVFREGVRSVR